MARLNMLFQRSRCFAAAAIDIVQEKVRLDYRETKHQAF